MARSLVLLAFVLLVAVSAPAYAEKLDDAEKAMAIADRTKIRVLIEDLGNHRDAQVAAVAKLVEIGNNAVPMLIRYLNKADNENIRANICTVLGVIGAQSAVEPLGKCFSDKSPLVRYKAQEGLRLLARVNNDAALMAVVDYLRSQIKSEDAAIRELAVEVLVDLNPTDLWTEIIQLTEDSSAKVRADAVKALGGISAAKAENTEDIATICNALIKLADDGIMEVRRSTAYSLGFYVALSTVYIVGTDVEGRTVFADSPNKPVCNSCVQTLIKMLADKEDTVRAAAAYSLGKLWSVKADAVGASAIEALIAGLDDASAEVRLACAASLGRIGDKKAVEALVGHLEEKVPLVLNVIVEALERRTLQKFDFQPYEVLDETPEEPIDTPEKYDAAKAALEAKRQEAIAKWKQWWEENKGTFVINEMIR